MTKKEDLLEKLLPLLRKEKNKGESIGFLIHSKENKKREWEFYDAPDRELVLWGWDKDNNPSFLILYGKQEVNKIRRDMSKPYSYTNRYVSYELQDNVKFDIACVFRGNNGHLPSFESVALVRRQYGYREKFPKEVPAMYYRHATRYHYWYYNEPDAKYRIEGVKKLDKEILLPYFENIEYEKFVEGIQNVDFGEFRLAKNPNEVLQLSNENLKYYLDLYNILSNKSLYMRRKHLGILINSNPPKEIYELLMRIGSIEVLSGLFMELAKLQNPIILNETQTLLNEGNDFGEENYIKGLRRCALIYINAFNKKVREDKRKRILDNFEKIDSDFGKTYGESYRRYSIDNVPKYYRKNKSANIVKIKNTIQEAEIYNYPEVIGKIAYYIDSAVLGLYLKVYNKGALRYFRRYLRRLISKYLNNNHGDFREIIKALLTSYTSIDYLGDYPGDFSANKFIHIDKDFEHSDEIWSENIDDVIYIVKNSSVMPAYDFCYNLLKKSSKREAEIEKLSFDELLKLVNIEHKKLANMFSKALEERVKNIHEFDSGLMLTLMTSENSEIRDLSNEYFIRTNGKFSSEDLLGLLFRDNFHYVEEIFKEAITRLEGKDYIDFVKVVVGNMDKFKDFVISDDLETLFTNSIEKLTTTSSKEKSELILDLVEELFGKKDIPNFINSFIKNIIFGIPYKDLKVLVSKINIEEKGMINSDGKLVVSLVEAIKNNTVPSNGDFINILENATSQMVKMLVEICTENRENLCTRYATLVMMLECDVVSLNSQAKEIFNSLGGREKVELHKMIVDSPVEKVNLFGVEKLKEIYGEMIPKEFVVQMLEHTSEKVKAYISDKVEYVLKGFSEENEKVFIHYVKTLLYLPNKVSKSKTYIYNMISDFALQSNSSFRIVEDILLDIGGSNNIIDSERALVALAKLRKEAELVES